jgi:hypothetical protein
MRRGRAVVMGVPVGMSVVVGVHMFMGGVGGRWNHYGML